MDLAEKVKDIQEEGVEEEEASPNRANAQGRGGGEVAYPVRRRYCRFG